MRCDGIWLSRRWDSNIVLCNRGNTSGRALSGRFGHISGKSGAFLDKQARMSGAFPCGPCDDSECTGSHRWWDHMLSLYAPSMALCGAPVSARSHRGHFGHRNIGRYRHLAQARRERMLGILGYDTGLGVPPSIRPSSLDALGQQGGYSVVAYNLLGGLLLIWQHDVRQIRCGHAMQQQFWPSCQVDRPIPALLACQDVMRQSWHVPLARWQDSFRESSYSFAGTLRYRTADLGQSAPESSRHNFDKRPLFLSTYRHYSTNGVGCKPR